MSTESIKKTVYLVRHGETGDSVKEIFQSKNSILSDKGKDQAEKVAERAKRLSFEKIISSPYSRARETALAIAEATGKDIEFSDLFIEHLRPDYIEGKPFNDERAIKLVKETSDSLFEKDIRIEGAENYKDLEERATKILEFLYNKQEKEILIVTHGLLLKMVVAKVILGDCLNQKNFKNMDNTMSVKNTGITVLKYKETFRDSTKKWRLVAFNDHSHLG